MSDTCSFCEALADGERHVYDDDAWFAFAAADVPGWVMLATKRHREGMWSLLPDEAARLGPAVRALGRAVMQATDAHRVHLVFLGEHGLHFHLGFFPRAAGDPPLLDSAPLAAAAQAGAHAGRSRALADRIRAALAAEPDAQVPFGPESHGP